MKPGTHFFLLAGALAALLLAWFLLGADLLQGSEQAPSALTEDTLVDRDRPEGAAADDGALSDVEARAGAVPGAQRRSLSPQRKGGAGKAATTQQKLVATGPYTGRLVDPLGRPMGGVEVTIDTWENASQEAAGGAQFTVGRRRKPAMATTDEDGRFAVTSKKSLGRALGLVTEVSGYSDDPIHCVLDPDKGRDMGDVILQPAVIISGWVRDEDDRAVPGASIRRIDRSGDAAAEVLDQLGFGGLIESAKTDADGRFEMPHEDEGAIVLLIESDDILPKRWEGPTKRAGDVLQDVVIHVQGAGRIDGYVVGYPPGRKRGMVAAALLEDVAGGGSSSGFSEILSAQLSPAGDHTTKIRGDGSFTLPGLIPGAEYRLRAISKNFFVRTVELSDAVDARANGEPASLQFDPGTTVTFQAIDSKTSRPIEAMTISGKYGAEPAFVQLNATAGDPPDRYPDGKVTLFELRPKSAPRSLALTIDAPGYFRAKDVMVDVPASGTVNLGKVTLDPAPLLRIRVVDSATLKPVRRARVTVEPTVPPSFDFGRRGNRDIGSDEENEQKEAAEAMVFGEYRVRSRGRTDREGRCQLSMVQADSVTLEVRARGYATHVQAPFLAPVNDEDEVVVALFGGGTLRAFVLDTAEEPAAGVRVECRRESGDRTVHKGEKTDENGIADFEHLAAGTWEVRAFRTDDSLFAEGGRGGAAHPTEWAEVQVTRGARSRVDLEVPAVGDLSGLVLLGDRPSPDARLSLASPDNVDRAERLIEIQDQFAGLNQDTTIGITDFEGRFTLTDIIPGDYVLLTRHPDLAMIVRSEVEVSAGANSVTVTIPATSLEGRVVDDEGVPVAGASVSVDRQVEDENMSERSITRQFLGSDRSASTTTDVDGIYRLLGVTADVDLTVVVQSDGYADTSHGPVRATLDETVPVAPIELERAGSLLVRRDIATASGTMSFVRAEATGGHALEAGALDKIGLVKAGSARIDGLVAGTWEVTVQTTGQEGELATVGPETVEIKPGETVELEM